ncbi:hypothetical protein EV426DRAFT_263312 [Tirmania nivea]|nr:hypothetical protein EV426DRAFT_263312 [Tirmania nivea]
MEYISPISQQFSLPQEQPPPLTKNQRRLQLRHSLSNKTIPQIGTFDNDEEHVILQKNTRRRSSSTSSKASSNHSHYTSPFDNYEEFGRYSEFPEDRSKPSTPVDDILPDASPLRLGGSAASTMRKDGGKGLRKASFYSEASTLVSDGFGDLMLLSSQSIVGPRFYESGSGSGSDHGSSSKRERRFSIATASNKRRSTTRGRISMGNHHSIYTTPPRGGIMKDTSDHPYLDMHPENATKYIELLEQQTQDLTAQLHNLTSPTSSASSVSKLRKLTAENRALRNEIDEWETSFDDKVKEECRSRIIANEMEARARVKAMEQTLEETRETVKILHADIDRLNSIIHEVAHERDMAEKEKREVELKVEVLTEMLRAREGETRSSSRCSSRAGGRNDGGRYSQESYPGSVMAALRRSGYGRPLSISSSQFDESEGEAGYGDAPSARSGSPTQEPGIVLSKKRMTRSFEGGTSPQPLVLPTTAGISSPASPNGSRPTSAHSDSHHISFYGSGMQANSSNSSIDSGKTPSVRSGMSAIVTGGNSLFAELSMFEDGMSDAASNRDDVSEYSRLHSRVPSYTSFARQHHRGPSIITSPVAATPRIRSPTPIHSQLRSPLRSPILAASNEFTSVPIVQLPPPRSGIFSTLTRSSGPLHLVADALTRYKLGKILIAVGHGLKSPRVTLYKVRVKACEVAVKVLTGEMGVERVSKKRRKVWNQRGNAWNEDRNCLRCSTYERGRKVGKSARRSFSAPISSRVSNVCLSPGTPMEGMSREPSLVRDRSLSRRPPQHHRKRRTSTTSKQQSPDPVRRQHRVHAGDNVWLWFRFLMAIVVTLGVVGKNDEKDIQNEKTRYKHDVAVTDDEEDSYSDYLSEVDEDEEDTLESKVEKWRRSRVSEINSRY